MLWFRVVKSDPSRVAFLVNNYFGDFPQGEIHDLEASCVKVAHFDLGWCGNTTNLELVAVINANEGDKSVGNAGYIWTPVFGDWRGRRPVSAPLPERWQRLVKMYGPKKERSYHKYPFSLSAENLAYNTSGECVYHPSGQWPQEDADALGIEGRKWPEWLRMGIGAPRYGEALTFRTPRVIRTSGVSVNNKARRSSARILNHSISWAKQAIGLCQAASLQYSAQWSIRGLEMPDFIHIKTRTETISIMSAALEIAREMRDKQKGEDGQPCNNGDGWNVRFGATGATMEGVFSKLDQKYDNDLQEISRLIPGQDASGEEYWHLPEAQTLWLIADDWMGYFAQFAMFDYLCPDQEGLEDMSRLDNFTPLHPDLPLKVDGLPDPIKNPHKLHELGGL